MLRYRGDRQWPSYSALGGGGGGGSSLAESGPLGEWNSRRLLTNEQLRQSGCSRLLAAAAVLHAQPDLIPFP